MPVVKTDWIGGSGRSCVGLIFWSKVRGTAQRCEGEGDALGRGEDFGFIAVWFVEVCDHPGFNMERQF